MSMTQVVFSPPVHLLEPHPALGDPKTLDRVNSTLDRCTRLLQSLPPVHVIYELAQEPGFTVEETRMNYSLAWERDGEEWGLKLHSCFSSVDDNGLGSGGMEHRSVRSVSLDLRVKVLRVLPKFIESYKEGLNQKIDEVEAVVQGVETYLAQGVGAYLTSKV